MKGLTPYQLEILMHVKAGGEGAEPLDFDQLLERLSWTPTKESAQFTIRAVIAKNFLRKGELVLRRGRKRVLYHLTPEGEQVLDPRLTPPPVKETREEIPPGALPRPAAPVIDLGVPEESAPAEKSEAEDWLESLTSGLEDAVPGGLEELLEP